MALSLTLAQYAQPADLANTGLTAAALNGVSNGAQVAALQEASGYINSALADQFTLPLIQWGADIRNVCVQIASWYCLRARGYNPTKDADVTILKGYAQAMSWLDDVAAGKKTPDQLIDSSAGPVEAGAPQVLSPAPINSTGSQLRGW